MISQRVSYLSLVICLLCLTAVFGLPKEGDIQLMGSQDNWQGRVEIYYNSTWGTVCDDFWDQREAQVVCRQLNFPGAIQVYSFAAFGSGSGPIWMDNVRCNGSELKLKDCLHNGWGKHNCNHKEDGGVACVHQDTNPTNVGSCSFDGGLCGYTNANDDDFDWTQHQNSTPSFNTGPAHDHSTGYGNYIYIETSWPRVQGEMARIISPQLRDIKCVKFFYSMKGDSVNELSVYVDDGNDRKMVWQMRGEVSGVWEKAVIPIKGYSMFKVVFEGLVGTQHTGDIAIDDVSAVTTSCDALFPGNAKPNPPDLSKLNNTIRLVGGNVSSAGRIEVLHNNRWGTVCGSHFHLTAAKVVCRQLGFLDVETLVPCCLIHKPGKGTIWLDNLHCEGREPAINMCPHKGWGITRCLHTQDVGVICKTKNTLKQVRLAGSKNKYEGRVEIQIGGIWGTIMDYGWDIYDSTVICRQLGYSGASAVYSGARFGPGKGPIWLSAARCIGNETLFSQCNVTQHQVQWQQHWWWNPHRRDASTECYNLKLTGGKSKSEGLVEIQYLGNWGTICNELWDINDAQVICRQMGYSKVVSYKGLGYSPKPSNGSVPVLTRLKCKGDEVALGLCASDLLLSIKHSCTHDNDVMVKCAVPFPTASPPGPTPPDPGCASNCPTCLTNKRHGGICLCSSSENTNKITCDGKKDDCQVDVRFTKLTMKDWDAVKYKAKLADQLSKYCKTSSCGTNVSSTFTPDDIIFVGKPTVFNKHLILQFVVINPNPKSKTPISQMTIKNMINKDNNLGGYSVILENPRVAAQKGSGNTAKIVVPIVVVLVVFGVALVVFIIYRKRMALGSGGSASQRYLHLSHDDKADDHDDPLLTMDDDDIAPSTERT